MASMPRRPACFNACEPRAWHREKFHEPASNACRGHRPHPRPQRRDPRRLSRPPGGGAQQGPDPQRPGLHEPRPRLRRGAERRQDHAAREPPAQHRRSSRRTTTCCRRTSRSSAFPAIIKQAAREAGATAQFAGGVPAMCDGVTQGEPGMELSLFSRDVIAHGDRGRAVAQHVRRRAVPGRLRQDRAGPADRRAAVRPPAGDLRARRADDHRACPTTRRRASGSASPRARSAATRCSSRRRSPTTAPAPAPSTAPPTATRC